MSVIGVDFGNSSFVIAQAKRGGIDIVLNESSKRVNPNIVSFQGPERMIGEQAAPYVRSNYKNTITQVKRFIGRKFSEPEVQYDIENFCAYEVVQLDDDEIGLKVNYDGAQRVFTPQQVVAMLLTKSVDIVADANSGQRAADVAISVPPYYTDRQRRAMLDAAKIANVQCLRLVNDSTATALSYGIFKSVKGEFSEDKPTHVMFVDMGHANFNVSIVEYVPGKLKMKAVEWDAEAGGRNVDLALARHFAEEFKGKTGLDCWSNPKSRLRLLTEAEKAKKTLSPYGVDQVIVNIECLYQDNDFSTTLTLDHFESLVGPICERLVAPIKKALAAAEMSPKDLSSVEIVGGGMRPRCIKRVVASTLGMKLDDANNHELSTTLNMDEAVSRGSALACAMLSPLFRVKPFAIVDRVVYPVRVSYGSNPNPTVQEDSKENETTLLLPAGTEYPAYKRITLPIKGGQKFLVRADYEAEGAVPGVLTHLGQYRFTGIPSDLPEEEKPKLAITFSMDVSGVFGITHAELRRTKTVTEVVTPEADNEGEGETPKAEGETPKTEGETPKADGETPKSEEGDASMEGDKATAESDKKPEPKEVTKTKVTRSEVNLVPEHVGEAVESWSNEAMKKAVEDEKAMIERDQLIRATQAKRNELEEYIYRTRDQVDMSLEGYITEDEKTNIKQKLMAMEDWLYEDGFDADKATYQEQLDKLHDECDRPRIRKVEAEARPAAISHFFDTVERYKTFANSSEERYNHIGDEDRNKVRDACNEATAWLNARITEQESLPLTADPVLKVEDINCRRQNLESTCNPIMNKPKPKPPTPKKEEKPKEEDKAKKEEGEKEKEAPAAEGEAEADKEGEKPKEDGTPAEDVDMS